VKKPSLFALALILATGSSCVKKVEKIPTPATKKNLLTATREQLLELINQKYGALQSIKFSRLGVSVEAFYLAKGKKESYPKGSGYLVVQRPHWILMNVNNPLTHSTVAELAANGRTFQIWVPKENKYVTGPVDVKVEEDNPFYNIRPQHVFEAIFVRSLQNERGRSFYVFEDSDPQFEYYVIAEIENSVSHASLLRRVWIERSALRVVRQQWYGRRGELIEDARYGSETRVGGLPVFLDVKMIRPADGYRLSFSFEPDAIKVNEPVEESAFKVEKPPGAELVEVKGKASQ